MSDKSRMRLTKTADHIANFMRGKGIRICPNCDGALQLDLNDPWNNGTLCTKCNQAFSWAQLTPSEKEWVWNESKDSLIRFHGNAEEVEIPSHCKKICRRAFADANISAVHIPDSVEIIEPYAFKNAQITQVTLPDNLQRIEEGCFMNCHNLQHIALPISVAYIGKNAFSGCTSLTTAYTHPMLQVIDTEAFAGSGLTELKLRGVVFIGENAFANCTQLRTMHLKAKHLGKGCFSGCSALQDVQLIDGMMTIGPAAFKDCAALTQIRIPASVYELRHQAFVGCNKLSAQIPQALEEHIQHFNIFRGENRDIFDDDAKLHFYKGGADT